MPMSKGQPKLRQVAGLGCLRLEVRVMQRLAHHHGISDLADLGQASLRVRGIELSELLVQRLQLLGPVSRPLPVVDLDPKQRPECILKDTQVAGMHAVDRNVMQASAWRCEEDRGLHPLLDARLDKGLVRDQREPMSGCPLHVSKAQRAQRLRRLA